LPESPLGYSSHAWYYHDVLVKDEQVPDKMGWGNEPVPFKDWKEYYGDDVKIEIRLEN
jgi:hypothetical protein